MKKFIKVTNGFVYKNMLFELGTGQILLKDNKTGELIKVFDQRGEFDLRDLSDWLKNKFKDSND